MTQTAENALWRIKKRPIMDGYLSAHKQAENQVAGQGFLYRPGFLADAATAIEREAKFKLSEANFAIVQQMIERELAQTGFDYDIAVKEAMIAWQLEKAQTLTELKREFADNKLLREMDKEALNRLKIETDLRQLVIIAAKAQYEIDLEELKRQFFDVERSTFSYETALLNAKLVTANKKLEVIPYIEAVLEKQQLIIDEEENNADRKQALITEKEGLNDKRLELITAREAIAEAIVTLIAAKEALVEKKQALITAKEPIVNQELLNATYLSQYVTSLTGLDTVRQSLITAKNLLIPKINAKSTALIAYAAELDAWMLVKEAIADVKEEIADVAVQNASAKQTILTSKSNYAAANLSLKEARLALEVARMTGRSDLLTARVTNATEYLTAKAEALEAEIENNSEMIDAQLSYDEHSMTTQLETLGEVADIEIDDEVLTIQSITTSQVSEREGTTAAAAQAQLTSRLVHVLS